MRNLVDEDYVPTLLLAAHIVPAKRADLERAPMQHVRDLELFGHRGRFVVGWFPRRSGEDQRKRSDSVRQCRGGDGQNDQDGYMGIMIQSKTSSNASGHTMDSWALCRRDHKTPGRPRCSDSFRKISRKNVLVATCSPCAFPRCSECRELGKEVFSPSIVLKVARKEFSIPWSTVF